MPPICVGTLDVLSGTGTDCPNVLVDPWATPPRSRYFAAIVPLPAPLARVATSFPAAWLSVAPLPTALLWSTAPALRAKSTAANADPVLAMTSAAIEMIVAGCGLEIFMLQTTPAWGLGCGENGCRDQGPRRRALQGHRACAPDRRGRQRVRRARGGLDRAVPLRPVADEAVLRQVAQGVGVRVLPEGRGARMSERG